ncbi:MAG: hypothetical protein IT443_12225 [Phycisphaeraceae bacterium]|nr:hypothetical protein [Phycisphaeraceae bacterium]
MADRRHIATSAAGGLRQFASQLQKAPVLVGFDGFVDAIIRVVDKRHDAERFDSLPAIADFGHKVLAAAGMSSNFELVVKQRKLGGNGPIMAAALAQVGLPTRYIGALGYPEIHPVFAPLAQRADCRSIAEPACTDALEFNDGKLMLGKLETLKDVNFPRMEELLSYQGLCKLLADCRLLAMVNWTMLPHMNQIWQSLIERVLPSLPNLPSQHRYVFIDLADPEKRTADDLRQALNLCAAFEQHAQVILGLNFKEATQVAAALHLPPPTSAQQPSALTRLAGAIQEKLRIHAVVIHPRHGAAAALGENGSAAAAWFAGPFVAQPKLSTGAGDNFNAGFCVGLLADLPLPQALCVGTALSGYYVRHAASPTLAQLADFCADLPPGLE